MKLACWKIVVSKWIPSSPGSSDRIASSTPRVSCTVFAQGSFSTTSSRPGWSLMTALPINGGKAAWTVATSPIVTSPLPPSTVTPARSAGPTTGSTCCTPIRWFGVSTIPPVPITDPLLNFSNPELTALEVASITSSRATCRAAIRSGSTCTLMVWMRSFHIATLATPGTCSSRARTVQYAVMDICITVYRSDVIPILTAREVADSGAMITGGAAQVGRLAVTPDNRSCTSCRARNWSVPDLKISRIEDSWCTDRDRSWSRPGRPVIAFSSGTVTSSSTSEVDSPTAIVWISTRGGENSGNTSSRIDGNRVVPPTISARPAATTR